MTDDLPERHNVRQELRRLWGDRLTPVPPQVIAERPISAHVASLLTEIGLPWGSHWITFDHDERLLELMTQDGVDFLRIAEAPGGVLAFKVGSQEIWKLDGDMPPRRPPLFVNSDLALLLLFLGLYDSARPTGTTSLRDLLDEMYRHFADRDPLALSSTAFWTLVHAETEEDLQ